MIIKEIPIASGDVMGIPGDWHFDEQDDAASELMLRVWEAFRVNNGVLTGDSFDSIGISRYPDLRRRAAITGKTLKKEKAAAKPYFEAIENIVRRNRGDLRGGLYHLTGNHEHWWRALQDEYPGLDDTPWFEMYGDLFDGWHVFQEHTALKFGPLLVCHGHRLRGSLSKQSARTVLSNYPGQNTIYGHTHRVEAAITPTYKYGMPVDHGAWTVGHLRDIQKALKDPFMGPLVETHRQGFALVHFHEVAGELRFKVDLVTIDRGPNGMPYCIVGGVLFE